MYLEVGMIRIKLNVSDSDMMWWNMVEHMTIFCWHMFGIFQYFVLAVANLTANLAAHVLRTLASQLNMDQGLLWNCVSRIDIYRRAFTNCFMCLNPFHTK